MTTNAELRSRAPAAPPLRKTADLMQEIAATERQITAQTRTRNEARLALQRILLTPDSDQLEHARTARQEIRDFDGFVEHLTEKRRALQDALAEAQERDRAAEWAEAKQEATAAASQVRASAHKIQEWAKAGALLIEQLAKAQAKFVIALAPAEVELATPLLGMLPQIVAMQLYAYSDGKLPPPRNVYENPWQLRQERSAADLMRHVDDYLVPALRHFDRGPPGAPALTPPEAA